MKQTTVYLLFILFFTFSENIFAQDNQIVLDKNWNIQCAEKVTEDGSIISTPGFNANQWYKAQVPSTVLATLVNNGVYKDVYVGENLKKIPTEQFQKSWWYRTEFSLSHESKNKFVKIEFQGINYRANIWLNGKLIANNKDVSGTYRMFSFDISSIVNRIGKNVLAVEVFPPKPEDPTISFADWNPAPPDINMGIFRRVKLIFTGDVGINFPFVKSKVDLKTLRSADLTISAELVNNSTNKITGILTGEIDKIKFSKKISLMPSEKNLVEFTPQDFVQLKINNPRLWWNYQYGKPNLYELKLSFKIDGKISDETKTKFGIREFSSYVDEKNYRVFTLNGKRLQILGGGWADDLLLNNNHENINAQLEYVKLMGLNTVRLEGFWGTDDEIYNLCDEKGILLMAGWNCVWEYRPPNSKSRESILPKDINLAVSSWKDQIKYFRNHASIFVWLYGSDWMPRLELETEYQKVLKENDPDRPFLASSDKGESSLTGVVGVKHGPYDYVAPVYWWIDTRKGGAFGFNTEAGPGAAVPPEESVKKMIPKENLWPIDSVWEFHNAINVFKDSKYYNEAIDNRLGVPKDLSDYCTKAQYLNYESNRALFEAMEANKNKATGFIYWMLNSSWPKLWWQLYDYYLMPGGGFFGTQKACEPVHILYNYGNNSIMAANNTLNQKSNLKAKIRLLNFDLSEKYSKEIQFDISSNNSISLQQLPEIGDLSKTYFLDLRLMNGKETIGTNFYCLSSHPDIVDTAKTKWMRTSSKEFADLTALNDLQKVNLKSSSEFTNLKNGEVEVTIELTNDTKALAFQIVLTVTKGKGGESVLPIYWDDNYFSMLPGEKRIIKGHFPSSNLNRKKPELKVTGWNIN